MIRTEITGAEIAEEMEKERRLFQLHMCEVTVALYRLLRVIAAIMTKKKGKSSTYIESPENDIGLDLPQNILSLRTKQDLKETRL